MVSRTKWLTIKQAAAVFGKTEQGIRNSYLPQIEKDRVDRTQQPMLVDGAALLAVHMSRELARQQADDPLLASSSDSPALERYRAAKAETAELDLAERRGELISVERGRDWITSIMSQIRQFGDRLRSHPELQSEFADMLNDCKRLVETMDDYPKQ